MKRHRLWMSVLVTALTLAGCEFDLTEVGPDTQRPPRRGFFGLNVDVRNLAGSFDLRAVLHPGEDESDVIRLLHDDSLRLDGVPFAPFDTTFGGIRHYRLTNLDPTVPSAILDLPLLPGNAQKVPQVSAEPLRVLAPDTIVVQRSASIRLRLAGLGPTPDAGTAGWGLRFGHDCTSREIFTLSGRTPPQEIMEVPVSLLPADVSRLYVLYFGSMTHSTSDPEAAYEVRVERDFSVCIPVRIED